MTALLERLIASDVSKHRLRTDGLQDADVLTRLDFRRHIVIVKGAAAAAALVTVIGGIGSQAIRIIPAALKANKQITSMFPPGSGPESAPNLRLHQENDSVDSLPDPPGGRQEQNKQRP